MATGHLQVFERHQSPLSLIWFELEAELVDEVLSEEPSRNWCCVLGDCVGDVLSPWGSLTEGEGRDLLSWKHLSGS